MEKRNIVFESTLSLPGIQVRCCHWRGYKDPCVVRNVLYFDYNNMIILVVVMNYRFLRCFPLGKTGWTIQEISWYYLLEMHINLILNRISLYHLFLFSKLTEFLYFYLLPNMGSFQLLLNMSLTKSLEWLQWHKH